MTKSTALKVSIAVVAAVAIALVGVLVGTRVGGDNTETTATEYWRTQSGRLDMQTQTRNAISDLLVRKGGIASRFGETKYQDLSVTIPADVYIDGKDAQLWFKATFAAGKGSVMLLGDPEIALAESDL
ncbi:hypothetical protein ACWDYH_00160 [Nocardia goodfellowii]